MRLLFALLFTLFAIWLGVTTLYFTLLFFSHWRTRRCDMAARDDGGKRGEPEGLVGRTAPIDLALLRGATLGSSPQGGEEPRGSEGEEVGISEDTTWVDEGEDLLEEVLLLTRDAGAEVNPTGLVMRELEMLKRASESADLPPDETVELAGAIAKLQGSELLEKYHAQLMRAEEAQSALLSALRGMESPEDAQEGFENGVPEDFARLLR